MTQANLKNNPNSSLLKETRISKGLSLEIVHEATKIPMDALRAIEEGYSTRMLTPFYYRGFVKIYAEFLGLNIDEVLKEYNVQPAAAKTAAVVNSGKLSTPKSQKNNAAAEQFQEFWRGFWTARTKRNLLRIVAAIIVLFVCVKMVGCVANFIKNRPKSAPKVAAPKDTAKKKESAKEEKAVSQDKEADPIIPVVSANHKVTLTAHAPRDVWMQVKSDGNVVFQMTMKKGTVENWEAKDKIELSGKNINELDLEVNGKDVNLSASSSRRVSKVIITKDGLTVKK